MGIARARLIMRTAASVQGWGANGCQDRHPAGAAKE